MLQQLDTDRRALYLTNQYGQKLLKILVKSESDSGHESKHAQIKLIPYGTKRAWLWRDQPSDPQIVPLRNGVNLTYHGGWRGQHAPKVHIEATSGYTTLIKESLSLPSDIAHPVPLFSFETGCSNQLPLTNAVTKRAHVVSTEQQYPIRFDLYIASAGMDMEAFINSMYFFSLFWSLDYLAAKKNCPLTSGKIVTPISFCRMGAYKLAVRRSVATHNGRPRLHFYSNKDYYAKLMNRPTATRNADGSLAWSTMALDEQRISAVWLAADKP